MTVLICFAVSIMSFTTSKAMWSFQLTRSHTAFLQTTYHPLSITSHTCYADETCDVKGHGCHSEGQDYFGSLSCRRNVWDCDRCFDLFIILF